ncbi:MAG: hypothetical protein ACYTF0_09335 [Planctomycetota bacterium]|jgi:hypothetical protein
MDLATTLVLLSGSPLVLDSQQVVLRGAMGPLHLPAAIISHDLGQAWYLDNPDLTLASRIAMALDLGAYERAWQLIDHQALADPLVATRLDLWCQQELRRRGLVPDRRGEVVITVSGHRNLRALCANALRDVRDLMPASLWTPWRGPLLIDPSAEGHSQVRPALPLLAVGPGPHQRDELAGQIAELGLGLLADRDQPWPQWLHDGLRGVISLRSTNRPVSPRQMQERRRAAGHDGLSELLLLDRPNPELATAVMAYILHGQRRHRLDKLLELLRHGADGLSALEIVYHADRDTLLSSR